MIDLEKRLDTGPLEVRTLWSDEKTARLAPQVLLRRRRRFFVRAAAFTMSGLVLVLVLGFAARASHGARPMAFSGLDLSALVPRALSFADGSKVRLETEDGQLHTQANRVDQVRLRLLGGAAYFDVVPREDRIFVVECDEVRVTVVGTAFTVEKLGPKARVAVERGRVEVTWRGGQRLLGAGERATFPPHEPVVSGVPSTTSAGSEAPGSAAAPLGWRELARLRRYDRAYAELFERRAGSPPESPADLLLAADVARLSRHPAEAISPLDQLVRGFPGDSRAPAAAFTLGRVLSEDLGRASDAADAFERARRLAPGGPLALDALAREITVRNRSGQKSRAQQLAREYLTKYPGGRHAPKLRELLAAP